MDIKYLKGICLVLTVVIVAVSGKAFYDHRHFQEEVVLGPGITTVKRLSDYFGPLAGSLQMPTSTSWIAADQGEPP